MFSLSNVLCPLSLPPSILGLTQISAQQMMRALALVDVLQDLLPFFSFTTKCPFFPFDLHEVFDHKFALLAYPHLLS
eukprot:m.102613 g.102613  ORF g.102613 m.102613 type:complete len:77 (-) comp22350_c0_seq3:62-292(-)